MKHVSKIILIPPGATIAQMETSLNTQLSNGFEFVTTLLLAGNTYAVFTKQVAE